MRRPMDSRACHVSRKHGFAPEMKSTQVPDFAIEIPSGYARVSRLLSEFYRRCPPVLVFLRKIKIRIL